VPEVRALRATVVAFFLQPAIHAAILIFGGRDVSPDRYRLAVLASQGVLVFLAALAPPTRADQAGDWQDRFGALCGVSVLLALLW
jgi:hypothetical protein